MIFSKQWTFKLVKTNIVVNKMLWWILIKPISFVYLGFHFVLFSKSTTSEITFIWTLSCRASFFADADYQVLEDDRDRLFYIGMNSMTLWDCYRSCCKWNHLTLHHTTRHSHRFYDRLEQKAYYKILILSWWLMFQFSKPNSWWGGTTFDMRSSSNSPFWAQIYQTALLYAFFRVSKLNKW